MKKIALVLLTWVLSACSAPPVVYNSPQPSPKNMAIRSEVDTNRKKLDELRKQLNVEKRDAENAALKKEIDALEARVEELEKTLADKEAKVATEPANPTYAPTTGIGPRGGCYRISKNGKKYYVKC